MTSQFHRTKYKDGKELAWFKKKFQSFLLNNIFDYVDIFLKSHGGKYHRYLNDFINMSNSLGFNLNRREIEEIIFNKLLEVDNKKYKLKGKGNINQMIGVEFEIFLARFFHRCGYKVQTTQKSNDRGADLILYNYGNKYVVQAKRRKQTVGCSAIYEVIAAREYYNADKALVIITSHFSTQAIKLAEELDVELWDKNRLLKELESYSSIL